MGSPRLRGAVKYVRRVKGGKWQARPYCDIEHERYNLGLFPTEAAAAAAIAAFWKTSKGDRPKFVRAISFRDGSVRYSASLKISLGLHDTPEQAAEVVKDFLARRLPPAATARLLSRKESDSHGARSDARQAEIAQRRQVVAEMFRAGWTHRQIADVLGVGCGLVSSDVRAVVRQDPAPAGE